MATSYIQGETFAYTLADADYTNVVLRIGAASHTLTKSASSWVASIDTSSMSGAYRYAAIADGKAVDTGTLYVKALVSKYRAVVTAIDAALQGVATNGKYSISVGEISMTDKTFDEMVKARNYYERLAAADENGVTPSFGPTRITEVYS